jgi:hypothetical protein
MATERTDQQKALNNSLTPPEQDLRGGGRQDSPVGGGKEVRAGSGGPHAPPGYGAPPGRTIDRDADPAAPDVSPDQISHHPGQSPAAGAGRGPGEAAPPGTVADRAGGSQTMLGGQDLKRSANPAKLDGGAVSPAAEAGGGMGGSKAQGPSKHEH